MKSHLIFSLIAVLLLAGCRTAPESSTYTYKSPTGGQNLDMTLPNLLESQEDRSYLIWLNAIRHRQSDWDARYYLEVRYEGASDAGYLDIGPGQTLIVTIDGLNKRFSSVGSDAGTRSETDRGTFVETALYPTDADTIKRIAVAKEVKVQVNGQSRKLYREFSSENIMTYRTFVLSHMGGF